MNSSRMIIWEARLARLALTLLLLATAYGVVAGAGISMYYDVTPNMGALEDSLATFQFLLYLLAVMVGFAHLPMAITETKDKRWKHAFARAVVAVGPMIVFLGTEGLLAHFVWWQPISNTDQFHMLHHTVLAGVPLALGYWLALRWWWRPEAFGAPSLSRRALLASGIGLVLIVMALAVVAGLVPPIVFGVTTMLGILAIPFIWRVKD